MPFKVKSNVLHKTISQTIADNQIQIIILCANCGENIYLGWNGTQCSCVAATPRPRQITPSEHPHHGLSYPAALRPVVLGCYTGSHRYYLIAFLTIPIHTGVRAHTHKHTPFFTCTVYSIRLFIIFRVGVCCFRLWRLGGVHWLSSGHLHSRLHTNYGQTHMQTCNTHLHIYFVVRIKAENTRAPDIYWIWIEIQIKSNGFNCLLKNIWAIPLRTND